MGLKHEARKAAIDAGVPVLSGTSLLTTLEDAVEQAERIGYPVMLKATGGGGGMGMEVCETPAELALNFEKTVGKALVRASPSPPQHVAARGMTDTLDDPSAHRPCSPTLESSSRSTSGGRDTSRSRSLATATAA